MRSSSPASPAESREAREGAPSGPVSMKSVELAERGAGIAWDAAHARWSVQVFGAGGASGRELVRGLLECGHAPGRLTLFGRSARMLQWRGQRLPIHAQPASPPRADLAFLCTPPELSRELAPRLAERGTRVIDLGGGLCTRPGATLCLAEVNGAELGAFTEELALPLPTAALIAPALVRLEREVGLAEVDLFAVVGAAAAGAEGIFALRAELRERGAEGGTPSHAPEARVGNLRPGEVLRPGFEAELGRQLRTLLGQPELLLDVDLQAGDLERCDAFALKVLLHAPLEPQAARELFAASDSLQVVEDGRLLTPASSTGRTRLQVGRIRSGSRGPRSLCFSAAGDQLLAGSSCAALRVAARLPVGG